jgi:ABC-type phosphate/phosphonate transport system ATPase subunit
VEKTYRSGRVRFRALSGVDLAIAAGEMVAITGPSGSGRTTIINLIAGIDRPTAGTATVNGSRLDQMTEDQLAAWRGRTIGIAEAVVLAAVGLGFGVLLGWLIYQGLLALLLRTASTTLPEDFPPVIPMITLAGILVLTLRVIRGPLRRATWVQPGTALRYQ